MFTRRNFLAFACVALFAAADSRVLADTVTIDPSRYAAIAYSTSTGKYGYAYDWGSRAQAERVAVANCKAADARPVGWVKSGWLVLAVADDNAYGVGYVFGDGITSRQAQIDALNLCKQHTKSKNPPKIKLIVCSGDVTPRVYED